MNPEDAGRSWVAEIPGWTIRVVVCAVPSAALAFIGGYTSSEAALGMVAGVALWTLGAALAFSALPFQPASHRAAWMGAFRQALWIKSAWTIPGALLGACLQQFFPSAWSWCLGPLVVPAAAELWTGALSIRAAEHLARNFGYASLTVPHSVAWTLVTTLVQGAAVVLMIAAFAAALRAWRSLLRMVRT